MCKIFEYVRGVVFVVVIFSINSCDNLYICIIYIFEFVVDNYLYIYYFESVSCRVNYPVPVHHASTCPLGTKKLPVLNLEMLETSMMA